MAEVTNNINNINSNNDNNKVPTFGMRYVQALLIFLNIVVIYISRFNVGIAVVAMTNAETTNPNFPEFDWSEKEMSFIISSFYWTYVLTQFPGGPVCKRFGAKATMLVCTLCSAILSALLPWSVLKGDWKAYCAVRLLQGLFQGMLFPCIHEHLAKWSPPHERNRLGALSHTGIECGSVLALGVSGLIAESPLGWPGISYVSAGLCFAWCILWYVFAANNATESKFITHREMKYIETSLARSEDFHKKKIPTPWKAIVCSVPVAAMLTAKCAEGWGLSIMQSQIPSYMNGVLNMAIKSNALFSALPFLAMWCMSYVYLIAADIMQRKKGLSLTSIRRITNSCAFWISAVALVGIGFLDEGQKPWAIAIMTVAVGVNSGCTIGCILNPLDLSPNHAGILMGISNAFGNLMPLITPLVVGVIVSDTHNRSEWQLVFLIAAIIFFVGNTIYIIWGTAETQPWDAEDFLLKKDLESNRKSDKNAK